MELEAPMMVDALPGRQPHSGSRLATETGFGVQHCGCLFFLYAANIRLEKHKIFSCRSPKRRRSRSNSRSRRPRHRRSRSRERRHYSPRSRSLERKHREKERERRQKGLPPSKDETLSGESLSGGDNCSHPCEKD